MKRKIISLLLMLTLIMSIGNTCSASTRYIKAVDYSYVGIGTYEDASIIYLTKAEADKLADKWRTSTSSNFLALVCGFIPKVGPAITLQYFGFAEERSRIANQIDNAADLVGTGKLLKIQFRCVTIQGTTIPTVVKTSVVNGYPSTFTPPSGYKTDSIDYIYIDGGMA